MYKVVLKKTACKELDSLPGEVASKFIKRIEDLEHNPYPRDTKKLSPTPFYRIRQGRYRLIYEVDEPKKKVTILRVGPRRDIYRRLNKI